jgi:thiamine-phosphate pyrophosphorylase
VGAALIPLARRWATRSIDYIQIREKDLNPDDLRELTQSIVAAVREINQTTKVLLNGPASIALAAGADGVHLPANTPSNAARNARALFARSGREATLSHSCHSIKEVLKVREESQRDPHATSSNTLILYAPVFEKIIAPPAPNQPPERIPGQGLDALRAAVHAAGNIPVLALGGITPENAPTCLKAGASGIAAIRLFLRPACMHFHLE